MKGTNTEKFLQLTSDSRAIQITSVDEHSKVKYVDIIVNVGQT